MSGKRKVSGVGWTRGKTWRELGAECRELQSTNRQLLEQIGKLQKEAAELRNIKLLYEELQRDHHYALVRDAEIQRKLLEKLSASSR